MAVTENKAPLSIPGSERTSNFHHKALNGSAGAFIIHAGIVILVSNNNGLITTGRARVGKCPPLTLHGEEVKIEHINPEASMALDGTFWAWQEGKHNWLFLYRRANDKNYLVRYQES